MATTAQRISSFIKRNITITIRSPINKYSGVKNIKIIQFKTIKEFPIRNI